jgi:chromosomal replication initiation ATPase DnaA
VRDRQLRLDFAAAPSYARADFIVTASNAEAAGALDAWPAWPSGRLALTGPEGSGKTHLAAVWAARAGAHHLAWGENLAAVGAGPLLLEGADRHAPDEWLFHLINAAEGGLLITANQSPARWPASLADLRSRLGALPEVRLGAPDDALLEALMRKLFRERQIAPADDLIPYLIHRIERSARAAQAVVAQLDEAGGEARREITRALAREILEAGAPTGDMFD